ncbi:ImmA/IrrE family metallo-endopeptidase [Enterovirga rhinocerotis]|uniref:Uncharacterized protein DUF955 n=1 Tax=Enterovirga rhinocerotis TaxID=1339210 RepID=A0A4R7BUQ5_9HYPH|nr:ImmA/IrrE family metallo-endopeptidase [Enterovirga rhinocerotis]TDR89538.1 uncharacterized protein DUF955 [Enterovirga rhinocerotis]
MRDSELLPIEIIGTFLDRAPVDVEGMARALGLIVLRVPLPDNISGSIRCERDGPCTVEVNALHPNTRQRFTLAHEIAHYAMHRDLIGDGVVDNALYRSEQLADVHERQANSFAARTLMPRSLVREAWEEGLQTAPELAERFGVSTQVAEIRMRELGCIFWTKKAPAVAA